METSLAQIWKEFTIEAAHRLPNVPAEHKCSRLHGHSFHIEVHVRGPIQDREGWVTDFASIKTAFSGIDSLLDHSYLNDIPGLENPTSEILAKWIWDRLIEGLPNLIQVTVRETCTTGCIYRGGRP